jgi:hypothetical protein
MFELRQDVFPSEDGCLDERRQQKERKGPEKAPSEWWKGPAPSEEQPAQ